MTKKLVYGWGINDADYIVCPRGEDEKQHWCLIYQCWMSMIQRCRCPKYQVRYQTYVGCWVDERWRSFMAFRSWYLEQNPKPGEQLDKDFLGDGKLYSPETCCFVSRLFNSLFNDCGAVRGEWPQGVYYDKQKGKFRARIRIKGKLINLGYFDTPEEASEVYLEAKGVYVEELLAEFPQPPRLAAAIRQKMRELIQQARSGPPGAG